MDVQVGTSTNNAEQDYTMAVFVGCWLGLTCCLVRKPFYHNQLTSPKTFDGFPFCFQL